MEVLYPVTRHLFFITVTTPVPKAPVHESMSWVTMSVSLRDCSAILMGLSDTFLSQGVFSLVE